MTSMKDIAVMCGVSIATVSKALNDHRDISEATKERIRQVAADAGYFPNAAARTLKTNRSHNLGILFADAAKSGLTHDYFAAVLEGFKLEAEKQGYDITFINTFRGYGAMSYVERCRYRNMDGVVIACTDFENPEVLELINSAIPTVTIDYIANNCTSVISDNVHGMQELTEYIIKKGHKRIAYIHGDSESAVTKERLASFYRTMDNHGLNPPAEFIRPAKYLGLKDAAKHTEELLKLKHRPSCIIYPDDTALIGGLNVIREHGLKIPDDISVAGYDGLRVSRFLVPKITTIHQNTDEIGKSAAIQLIKLIEKPKTTLNERIIVEGELIEGGSVGRVGEYEVK